MPRARGTTRDVLVSLYDKELTHLCSTATESGAATLVAEDSDATTRIVVSNFVIQTASSSPVTVSLQNGTTTQYQARCANEGDGLSMVFPPGLEWRLASTGALTISLGSTGKVLYSVAYFTEEI